MILRAYEVEFLEKNPLKMDIRHFSVYLQEARFIKEVDVELSSEERREIEERGEILIEADRAREMGIETGSSFILLRKA